MNGRYVLFSTFATILVSHSRFSPLHYGGMIASYGLDKLAVSSLDVPLCSLFSVFFVFLFWSVPRDRASCAIPIHTLCFPTWSTLCRTSTSYTYSPLHLAEQRTDVHVVLVERVKRTMSYPFVVPCVKVSMTV